MVRLTSYVGFLGSIWIVFQPKFNAQWDSHLLSIFFFTFTILKQKMSSRSKKQLSPPCCGTHIFHKKINFTILKTENLILLQIESRNNNSHRSLVGKLQTVGPSSHHNLYSHSQHKRFCLLVPRTDHSYPSSSSPNPTPQ